MTNASHHARALKPYDRAEQRRIERSEVSKVEQICLGLITHTCKDCIYDPLHNPECPYYKSINLHSYGVLSH